MHPIKDVPRAREFYEREKDVAFKGELIDSPVCRMAVCLDSEGNSILLHQLKAK